ncbi:MAG TPA: thymidine phosphorylase [Actinomycetota bacterium]|nr:thymidine phosphorylase [Actinomycetota bacterium]
MAGPDLRQVVARKRDGLTLHEDEIRSVVLGYAKGEVTGELAAAFLMAAFTRGLDGTETAALTRAMVESGRTLPLKGISRPTVDKHSTGGVADGVTLVFAPLAASLGLAVAKLSGRGLGHTGGTLDKLESIPGFRTDLSPEELERQVDEVGCAVAAQTPDLVPADGALYSLRDATATVPSIPLIAASVMSKKLAVETDLILLDVKAGGGAFMKTVDGAESLAVACIDLAAAWNRRARAAVTDMSQPLGNAVGNALDVSEAIAVLRGEDKGRLARLSLTLAVQAQQSLLGSRSGDARDRAERALSSGRALETFRRMVEAQGGDPKVVDDPSAVLPAAPVVLPIASETSGVVAATDAEAIGRASAALGAGRATKEAALDPAVGIVIRPKIGDRLEVGQPIGEVHARDDSAAREAAAAVRSALTVTQEPVFPPPLVYGWRHA